MKYVQLRSLVKGKEPVWRGLLRKAIVTGIAASFCWALMGPTSAKAANMGDHPVTQLDFIKWLVALTGDTPLFDDLSTVGDYVYWAKKYKMKPKGGWHPDTELSQDLFAELLVDFYRIKSKKGEEIETLAREGIYIPDQDIITWDGLVSVVDDEGFQSRLNVFSHNTCSPITGKKHKITIKECTPPPPPVSDDPKRKFRKFKEKKEKSKQ